MADHMPYLDDEAPPTRDQALTAAARCLRRAEAEPGMTAAEILAGIASAWVEVAAVAHAAEQGEGGL